jgi:hypothetical protein
MPNLCHVGTLGVNGILCADCHRTVMNEAAVVMGNPGDWWVPTVPEVLAMARGYADGLHRKPPAEDDRAYLRGYANAVEWLEEYGVYL